MAFFRDLWGGASQGFSEGARIGAYAAENKTRNALLQVQLDQLNAEIGAYGEIDAANKSFIGSEIENARGQQVVSGLREISILPPKDRKMLVTSFVNRLASHGMSVSPEAVDFLTKADEQTLDRFLDETETEMMSNPELGQSTLLKSLGDGPSFMDAAQNTMVQVARERKDFEKQTANAESSGGELPQMELLNKQRSEAAKKQADIARIDNEIARIEGDVDRLLGTGKVQQSHIESRHLGYRRLEQLRETRKQLAGEAEKIEGRAFDIEKDLAKGEESFTLGNKRFSGEGKVIASVPEDSNFEAVVAINKADSKQTRHAAFNSDTGQYVFPDGSEVGDEWVVTKTQASGGVGDFGTQPKEMEQFRQAEVATRNVLTETTRLKEQLGSSDTFVGLLSSVVRGIDSLAGNFRQIAQANGQDDSALLNEQYDMGKFGSAAQSAAFQGNIKNLAYSLARAANPVGVLSNTDVQHQIDSIAANSGSKEQIFATLDEAVRRSKAGLKNMHTVLGRNGQIGEFPKDLSEQAETETKPKNPDDEILSKPLSELTADDVKGLSKEGRDKLRRMLQ